MFAILSNTMIIHWSGQLIFSFRINSSVIKRNLGLCITKHATSRISRMETSLKAENYALHVNIPLNTEINQLKTRVKMLST